MENIIFLDIDGVLNDNNTRFLSECIYTLKQLIFKFNAKVVIISSWQGSGLTKRRNKIINELETLGIFNIDFIDPNFEGDFCGIKIPDRVLGIIHYLKNNCDCNYVILDDEYYKDYKLLCLNYYRTKSNRGLKVSDYNQINLKSVNLNNFKNVNYYYRNLGEHEKITNELIIVLKKVSLQRKQEDKFS